MTGSPAPRSGLRTREVAVWGCLLLLGWMVWTRAEAATSLQPLAGPPPDVQPVRSTVGSFQRIRPVRPARVVIPAIGIDAAVIDLGLHPDGTLEVPKDFDQAGWWSGGAPPGAAGPAVLVGHRDSRWRSAVFKRVPDLVAGAEILVEDADGHRLRFIVTHVEQHPKGAFPTAAVYGPTARPGLRLVTCGGPFRLLGRSYRDNIIAFAEIAP